MDLFFKILFVVLAYFVGAIPFGFIFGKLNGVDLRKVGSGNIGATNCGRILGRKYAVLTYFLDALKGAIFVILFRYNILKQEWCLLNPMLYGLVATIGATFPIYLKFKGGKSVSCGSGAIFAYAPILIIFLLLIWLIIKKLSKLVSVASISTALIALIIIILLGFISGDYNQEYYGLNGVINPYNYYFMIFSSIIILIVVIRHRSNIKNIIRGEEKPINY